MNTGGPSEVVTIAGLEFEIATHEGRRGTDGPVTLKKPHWMIERYLEIAPDYPNANMVELGLWDGGSTVFLASAFQPRTIVGFELDDRALPHLDRYIADSPDGATVHAELGVDQADTATLGRVIGEHIDGPLDVVVDDASHLLDPSTTSFDFLFPQLRAGGLYILEDWSHEHQLAEGVRSAIAAGTLDPAGFATHDVPSDTMGRLVVDLVLLCGSGNGMIEDIRIRQGFTEVRRGQAPLTVGEFRQRFDETSRGLARLWRQSERTTRGELESRDPSLQRDAGLPWPPADQ